MSNKLTIAISAALLVVAAAASVASAASSRPVAHPSITNAAAVATVCSELSSPLHAGRCVVGPHCFDFHIGDRTIGPTFPTSCRQAT